MDKWIAITIIAVFGFMFVAMIFAPESVQKSGWQIKQEQDHEKEMYFLKRDTMPFDSIVVIQGKRYKLEKIK